MTAEVSKDTAQTAPLGSVKDREPWQFEMDAEFRVLVTKLVSEHLAAQPTRDNEMIKLLELSQQSLKDSNDAMRTKLDKEWDKPQKVLTGISVIAAVFFGFNWFQQYAATQDFRSQTAALREQAKTVDEQFELFEEFDSEYHAHVERDQARRASSLRILALLDVARDQLIHRKNFDRALHYAGEASKELESLKAIEEPKKSEGDYKIAGGLARMCSQLDGAISLIQAECYFERGRPQDLALLRNAASRVVTSGCGCLEGHYFLGLCNLLESEQCHGSESEAFARTAVDELKKAIGEKGRSTLASIFLGAVQLEHGNLDAAIANAGDFLEDFPASPEGRRRLPADMQAQIWAASFIKELALFVKSPKKIEDRFGCTVDVGAIGPAEAAILERVFLRLARRKGTLLSDEREADKFACACLRCGLMLQRMSCGTPEDCSNGGCTAASPEVSSMPTRMLHDYGVIERVDLPPISRNLALGRRQENGDVVMTVARAVVVEETRDVVEEDGTEQELQIQVEKVEYVQVLIEAGYQLQPDHYVVGAVYPTAEDEAESSESPTGGLPQAEAGAVAAPPAAPSAEAAPAPSSSSSAPE